MKASELLQAEPWLKVLVYGDSGTGKTSWAARSPMPIILATERQAIPSIAVAAPDAEVFLINNYESMERIMDALSKGASVKLDNGQMAFRFCDRSGTEYTCQTIVIDSLSDMHTRIAEHVKVDEVEKLVMKRWGEAQKLLASLLQRLRSLPVNVVCICLQSTLGGSEGEARRTIPDLYGKMAEKVGQYFSAVGFAHKRSGAFQYGIAFNAGSGFVTKRPPTTTDFPDVVMQDLRTPGKTTLGSILLSINAGMAGIPSRDGDSGSLVSESEAGEGKAILPPAPKAKVKSKQ